MIGKRTGGVIYIHKSAIDYLDKKQIKRIKEFSKLLYKSYNYNFLIIHKHYIDFLDIPNFDTEYEPVLGNRYRVWDGVTKEIEFIGEKTTLLVLHQKWKTVHPFYKGFNIEDDKNRERWYKSYLKKEDMYKSGYKHRWLELINSIPAYNKKVKYNEI